MNKKIESVEWASNLEQPAASKKKALPTKGKTLRRYYGVDLAHDWMIVQAGRDHKVE